MIRILNKVSDWYFSKSALPYWCMFLLDLLLYSFMAVVADYLIVGGSRFANHFWPLITCILCTWPLYIVGMRLFHTYSGVVRYSSFVDLIRVLCALLVGIGLNMCLYYAVRHSMELPALGLFMRRGVVCLIGLTVMAQWAARIFVKYMFDTSFTVRNSHRAYIYGVRDGGISIAKSIRNEHPSRYVVRGFVSNAPDMVGRYLVGCRVHPADGTLVSRMRQDKADVLFVSPLCSDEFRNDDALVDALTKAGIRIMMMSSAEVWDGHTKLSHQHLREVDIEDLLPRDKIEVNMERIGQMLQGRCILITGAAGSIGSEMVHQVARFRPSRLVMVDQAETPMHDIRLWCHNFAATLTAGPGQPMTEFITIVGSITNQTQMQRIFSQYRPEYVFHAAAYKHVPMMEDNPAMAIQNNVYGTRVIADLAVQYGTRKFVMISTDKAVNPTNVMGCSKRICEIYCQSLSKALETGQVAQPAGSTPTQFITTRFGNVLGSNGSVIPIFREQIRRGGPVTVTHPDIIRYFMLIPEACQLVLEAGTMGHGGEIFVFDMGKPVRIADLAQRMIDLSGAKGVEIRYTGLRDGEKLYEEVLNDAETTKPTVHPKIKVASVREYPYADAQRNEQELYDLSFTYDDMAIVSKMKKIVPEYRSQHSKYEALDTPGQQH